MARCLANRLSCNIIKLARTRYLGYNVFSATARCHMQFAIYDVFADKPYGGNQAAVVRAGRVQFTDSQLIVLAEELAVAETALSSVRGQDLVFRFATADRVVNRCGHATLAGVADHVFRKTLSRRSRGSSWTGRYRVGSAVAEWRVQDQTSRDPRGRARGIDVAVAWPDRPEFVRSLPAGPVYRALGLDPAAVASDLPRCIYNSGNLNALVPVSTVAVLERAVPDWNKLRDLFARFRLTDLHLYCVQRPRTASNQIRLRCRNLFPYGVFEETATGTASVALAAALVDHFRDKPRDDFIFDQGNGRRRGNIRVRWCPRPEGDPLIWLQGQVFAAVRGQLVSIP
jgi:PhzF family phenazine biosynthesis protein